MDGSAADGYTVTDGRYQDLRYTPPASPLLRSLFVPAAPNTDVCERLLAVGTTECQPATQALLTSSPVAGCSA